MAVIEAEIGLELSDQLADRTPETVERDEAWFAERPGRLWRAREPYPYELDYRKAGQPSRLTKRPTMLIHRPRPTRQLRVLVELRDPKRLSQRAMRRVVRRCLGDRFELALKQLEGPSDGELQTVTFLP